MYVYTFNIIRHIVAQFSALKRMTVVYYNLWSGSMKFLSWRNSKFVIWEQMAEPIFVDS